MGIIYTSSSQKGKRKKYRNAEAAKQDRELAASWEKINGKWAPSKVLPGADKNYVPEKDTQSRTTDNKNIKSLEVWVTGTLAKKESQQYTGTKMLGVGTLHKSNSVPVFSDEEAIDLARMRR